MRLGALKLTTVTATQQSNTLCGDLLTVNSIGVLGCQLYLAKNAKCNAFHSHKFQIVNNTDANNIIKLVSK